MPGKVNPAVAEMLNANMRKDPWASPALYNEERGFMSAAELTQKAIETGKSVKEVVAEE